MTDTAPAAPDAPTADRSAAVPPQPARPRALSLRQNFSWTFAGNVVNAGSQWLLVALMAKLGSAEMVGLYSWSQALAMPILTAAMLQLRPLLVTDLDARHELGDYLGLRIAAMVLAMLLIAGYGAAGGHDAQTLLVLILVAASRAIDCVSDIFRGIFQRYEQMQYSAGNRFLRGLSSLAIVGGVLWLLRSLPWAMAALTAAWLLITLLHDVPKAATLARGQSLRPRLRWSAIKAIVPTSLPLGIMMGLIILTNSIPRLFLEPWHGKEAVGYYSAVYYPLSSGALIIGALGQAALPRLSRLWREVPANYLRLMYKLIVIAVVLGLVIIAGALLLGGPLLRYVYTPAFAAYDSELVIMSIGTAFSFVTSFLGYGLTAARRFRIQPLIAIVSCAVVSVASGLLVPASGVRGAAMAYTVSAVAGAVVSVLCMAWAVRQRLSQSA